MRLERKTFTHETLARNPSLPAGSGKGALRATPVVNQHGFGVTPSWWG